MDDGLVTLRCPDCGKTRHVARESTDYHDTHTVELQCDSCDDGDFHSEVHFDANGRHINRDPMLEPRANEATHE